ncbi:transcriptional regulator, TetR family [Kribbella flavida DSM 17836]|uniref:Transcriptional regulator, TetR family n=1 Tax=Kribbella flavida (strain DSM 17836 / JCM 10339 / NBRC 14399) TaxID=479435 RepID=D2PRQ3_KRIFD|nr:TetR/AcrR family transcriptional regulator [Kribbella flavida]ADB29233.1 transcriptional regulator, TetR family [Kribbella flavida DSM 17836]
MTPDRRLRADARRSREQILRAAEVAFARDGFEASLEAIAKDAGVGSATLHRHFRSRRQLVEAVFHERTEAVIGEATQLATTNPPGPALYYWLRSVLRVTVENRGLAVALLPLPEGTPTDSSCHSRLTDVAEGLIEAARATGDIRADVTAADVLSLVNAIALLAEQPGCTHLDAERLLGLTITGIGPEACASGKDASPRHSLPG